MCEALNAIRHAGHDVTLEGDRLAITPQLSPELLALAKQHKPAMVEALQSEAMEGQRERWALEEQDGACWLWLIVTPDGVRQCSYTPPETHERVAADHSDAVTVIPLLGRAGFLSHEEASRHA